MAKERKPLDLVRRSLGVIISLSPILVLLASIVFGIIRSRPFFSAALGLMVAACALAIWNFYLSFIRGRLYLKRHGSLEGYRYVSGVPLIGAVLAMIGGLVGFGEIGNSLVGLASMAFDTGGPVWFLICTWRDEWSQDSRG